MRRWVLLVLLLHHPRWGEGGHRTQHGRLGPPTSAPLAQGAATALDEGRHLLQAGHAILEDEDMAARKG